MREARARVKLAEVGITSLTTTRAITGALHFGVPGEDRETKADALASRLREVFAGREGIVVSRPVKTAELRLMGMEDSVTAEDIVSAVAKIGGCGPEAVKVGSINGAPDGLGSVWVRCPTLAARKAVGAGRLEVGWGGARVQLLEQRPLQCYKCLEGGHVRARCPNKEDRSGRCYRCGSTDHIARQCTGAIKCPLCTDLGLPAGHRAGSQACQPARRRLGRPRAGAGPRGNAAAPSAGGGGGGSIGPPPLPPETAQPPRPKKGERKRAREANSSPEVAGEEVRTSAKARLAAGDSETPQPQRRLRPRKPALGAQESASEPTPMEVGAEDLSPATQ